MHDHVYRNMINYLIQSNVKYHLKVFHKEHEPERASWRTLRL